ncbi:VOC family protein [Aquincola sp. S2]|uniref:VOC family protein n=1 Tax=Pseudaquabacterium terrae TaxID=2732868 RepID=A0ABX2EHQ0_9BURK|nr:VOC family protein [Aquabacterium terrae]NRF68101.1 VOC family protein [Aquabacterium terrae]
MYDHLGLRVRDLAASCRFYEAVLAPLGHVPGPRGDDHAGFGPPGAPALWLHLNSSAPPTGCHVAFSAGTPEAVHAFHAAGLREGGRDNGAPGPRAEYSASYYAAFLIDPDGNNVEAVRA